MSNISEMTTNGTIVLDLDILNQLATKQYIPTLVFLGTVMLIGLVGNMCVVLVYTLKLKKSSARVYIMSLALADMSVCLFGILYHFYDLTHSLTYESVITCKLLSFIISVCILSSIFILLVVGLDRYLKVCRPLKKQIVDFGDRKACLIATSLAGLFSVPYLAIYGHRTVPLYHDGFNISGSECSIDDIYIDASDSYLGVAFLGFYLLLFVGSILYLIIIYALICNTIRRSYSFNPLRSMSATTRCCFKGVHEDNTTTEITDIRTELETDQAQQTSEAVKTITDIVTANQTKGCRLNGGQEDTSTTEITDISIEHETNQAQQTPESANILTDLVTANQTVSESPSQNHITRINHKTGKKILRRTSNTMIRHTGKGTNAQERNSFKITMMMLTITVFFIVTFLPFLSVSILDGVDADFWKRLSKTQIHLFEWMLRIYVLNNVINPFIYCFWDAKFRQEISSLIRELCRCNSKT